MVRAPLKALEQNNNLRQGILIQITNLIEHPLQEENRTIKVHVQQQNHSDMAVLVNKNAPPMLVSISISGGSGKQSIHF